MNISRSINNENNPKRDISDICSIILHHTGNNSDKNKEYLNQTDYVSAHFVIQNSGTIWQLMDYDTIAYHAGVSSYPDLQTKGNSLNWNTIGIEVVGSKNDFTVAQQESLFKLTDYLRKKFNVDTKYILQHKDISPGRKIDPDESCFTKWDRSFDNFVNEIDNCGIIYDDNYGTYIKEIDMKLEDDKYINFEEAVGMLTKLTGENPLKEKDIKALINIAINRAMDELRKEFNDK